MFYYGRNFSKDNIGARTNFSPILRGTACRTREAGGAPVIRAPVFVSMLPSFATLLTVNIHGAVVKCNMACCCFSLCIYRDVLSTMLNTSVRVLHVSVCVHIYIRCMCIYVCMLVIVWLFFLAGIILLHSAIIVLSYIRSYTVCTVETKLKQFRFRPETKRPAVKRFSCFSQSLSVYAV